MRALSLVSLLFAACTGTIEFTPDPPVPDPFALLDRPGRGGPPRYTSRIHGCPKIRYATLANVLASRGVNLAATDPDSAGAMYRASQAALGGPNYGARVRENIEIGLATTAKAFDLYIQAAPEMIANQASRPECAGAPLFDAAGRCNARGLSCLIGMPATADHVAICNDTVAHAADPESGKQLAVAVIAAAAHTCE
jgi:hypothetical protein